MEKFTFHPGAADKRGLDIGAFMLKYADSIEKIGEFMVQNADLIKTMAQKLDVLQKEVGATPEIELTYFVNWIQNLERILFHVKPTSRSEIVAVVNACSKENIKMGAAGQYFSWAHVFPENGGMLINTLDLKLPDPDCPRISFNRANMTVTIAPGVTPTELGKVFAKEGVMFESDVYIPLASYGGIISGGGHGIGSDQGTVADYVTEVKIVNANGIMDTYPRPPPPGFTAAEVMAAAQVNLGLFGVSVEYTLRVKPLQYVRVDTTDKPLKEVLSSASQLKSLTNYWSLEIVWFPFNSLKGKAELLSSWDPYNDIVQIQDKVFVPQPRGSANNLVYSMEFCWGFDPNNPVTVVNAVQKLLEVVYRYRYEYFPGGLFVDMRFVGHSDTLICPCVLGQSTGRSFYIQIVGFHFSQNYDDFYRDLADEWFNLGGLPHWHKYWTILRDVDRRIHENFQGRMCKFEQIRKALGVDPNNLFVNNPFTKLLQYDPWA